MESCKLDRDAPAFTEPPTLLLSLSCAAVTLSQTACWDLARLAASFRSLVATTFSELVKLAEASFPLRLQRPDSTQKAAIGILPDFGGTMKSTEIIRSWSPPFTMSP